jgi:hypothetical protein
MQNISLINLDLGYARKPLVYDIFQIQRTSAL